MFCEMSLVIAKVGCFNVTNSAVADDFDITPRYVSNFISNLAKHGYIKVNLMDNNLRKIFIGENKNER